MVVVVVEITSVKVRLFFRIASLFFLFLLLPLVAVVVVVVDLPHHSLPLVPGRRGTYCDDDDLPSPHSSFVCVVSPRSARVGEKASWEVFPVREEENMQKTEMDNTEKKKKRLEVEQNTMNVDVYSYSRGIRYSNVAVEEEDANNEDGSLPTPPVVVVAAAPPPLPLLFCIKEEAIRTFAQTLPIPLWLDFLIFLHVMVVAVVDSLLSCSWEEEGGNEEEEENGSFSSSSSYYYYKNYYLYYWPLDSSSLILSPWLLRRFLPYSSFSSFSPLLFYFYCSAHLEGFLQ